MSATPRTNPTIEHGSSANIKTTQSQTSKAGSGDTSGGKEQACGEDSVINSQSDTSAERSSSKKVTSASSDANSSAVVTSAPNSSTNNSTSISPSSSSALPDAQSANIPTSTPLVPSSTVPTANSKGNSGQNMNSSGIDNRSGVSVPVNKTERTPSNRTTNGSESRASTDGHRTPNVENLSKTNLYIRGLASNTTDEALYNLCSQFGNITSTKAILDKITGSCRGYGFVQFSTPRSAEIAVLELNKSGVQAQMARISTLYSSHNQHHAHHNQHHSFHHNHFHPNHQNNGNPHHHHHHHHHHPNGGNNHGGGIGNHRNNNNNIHPHSQNTNNIHHNNNDPDPTNLYIANLPVNMSEQELESLLAQYGPVVSTRVLRDQDTNRSKGVGFARMESKDKCQEIIDNLNGKPYKGSNEPLLVKFADGGMKKRHQHNNHHHNNHFSHHHQQHHKIHPDEGRWRDTGNTSGDSSNISSFDQQSNIPHGNQMSDLTMVGTMGYHRIQPAFPPTMAPGTAYAAPLGPSTSGPQWIHPGGPGQPWNLIPQHMIPTSGLAPSNQAAAAAAIFHSQLASQMQGLQISHHHGAPIPEGYIPQWPAMWPHPVQTHQASQSHSMRLAGPMQHIAPAQQTHDQLSQTSNAVTSTASTIAPSNLQQESPSDSKQPGPQGGEKRQLQVSSPL